MSQSLTPSDAFEIFFSATERSDLDSWFALFDDHLTMRFPYMLSGYPNECHGRSECAVFFATVARLLSGLRWVKRTVYSTNDPELAIAIAASTATLPNGDSYENEYVLLLRVRNGAVVEYWEHFDPNRALGVFQALAA